MRCNYCGRENDSGKTFCSGCGKQLSVNTNKNSSSISSVLLIISVVIVCTIILLVILVSLRDNDLKAKVISETKISQSTDEAAQEVNSEKQNNKQESNIEKQTESETIYTVVDNPQYNEFVSEEYSFRFMYPNHFKVIDEHDDSILFSSEDPNGAAVMKVYAYKEIDKEFLTEFVNMYTENVENNGGRILDKSVDNSNFYCKAKYGQTIYCTRGYVFNDNMCCLDFGYAEFEEHVYENYYKYITENFLQKTQDRSEEDGTQ